MKSRFFAYASESHIEYISTSQGVWSAIQRTNKNHYFSQDVSNEYSDCPE